MNELNVKVAKALGYRIKPTGVVKIATMLGFDEQLMQTIDPNGYIIHEAWYDPSHEDLFAYVIDHLQEIRKLPNWQGNAGDAIALMENWMGKKGFLVRIEYARSNHYVATLDFWGVLGVSRGDTLPEVICNLFVEWHEAIERDKAE